MAIAREILCIEGMMCEHCVKAVTGALTALPGVRSAAVDLKAGTAAVDYEPGTVAVQEMSAAVEEQGYEVKG